LIKIYAGKSQNFSKGNFLEFLASAGPGRTNFGLGQQCAVESELIHSPLFMQNSGGRG